MNASKLVLPGMLLVNPSRQSVLEVRIPAERPPPPVVNPLPAGDAQLHQLHQPNNPHQPMRDLNQYHPPVNNPPNQRPEPTFPAEIDRIIAELSAQNDPISKVHSALTLAGAILSADRYPARTRGNRVQQSASCVRRARGYP